MSTHTVNIDEAQHNLAALIELVENGDEVVIARKNLPKVKIVVCSQPVNKRVAGLHKGKVQLSDDFNDSLDESYWMGEN